MFKLTPKEARAAWVAALRSGEYRQGKNALRSFDESHCCLGVACEVFRKLEGDERLPISYAPDCDHGYGYGFGFESASLPKIVQEWLDINSDCGEYHGAVNQSGRFPTLIGHNDEVDEFPGMDFNQIADLIESEPKGMFTEAE